MKWTIIATISITILLFILNTCEAHDKYKREPDPDAGNGVIVKVIIVEGNKYIVVRDTLCNGISVCPAPSTIPAIK